MEKEGSSLALFATALVMAGICGTSWAAGTQTVLVNTVDELTNAVAQATKSADYFEIVLKPGIYDLSNLAPHSVTNAGKTLLSWGTACAPDANKESHLVFGVKLMLRGENTKHWSQKTPEEESVIKGNGTMRLLYPYTGSGRTSTFKHLSFENGHTTLQGGAMYVMNTDDALSGKLTNCVFRNCSADSAGGATFNLSAFDCLYENNTAPKAGAAYGGCGNPGYPTNVFNNCVFRNNTATGASGGGALFCNEFHSIQGCTFSNNVSQVKGAGALYIEKPDSKSQIENCVFLDNVATDDGGAIRVSALLGRVVGCVFSNNVGSVGGALSALGGLGLVSNNVFALNRALTGSGGAAYVKTRTDKLVDCSFVGNTAQYSGGAYVASSSSIGEIARCSFKTNTAVVSVGGLSIGMAQERVSDCVFDGNHSQGDTGALFVGGKLTTLTNCVFVGNSAANRAAFAITAYDSIVGCTFKDNVAVKDYAGVAVDSFTNAGTIEDCLFDNNTNRFSNIGSQIRYAKQVTGCTFKGYGDMFALNYDRCIFDGCAFAYDNYGGGMIVFNTTTGAGHVRNCLFTNSTAHVYIKNDTGKTVEISNCTFVDNDAIRVRNVGVTDKVNMSDGYLVYAFRGGTDPVNAGKALPSTNRVVNCIFWNNRQNGVRNDVSLYTTETSVVTPAGNIIQNSMYGQVSSNSYFVNAVKSGLVVGNPKFLAGDVRYPEAPFYMIGRGSSARNTGLLLDWMTAEAVDLAGNARVVDDLPDMGCYECDLPVTGTMLLFR